jgi:glycerol-3-phosphate dehydrogenase (NAD(P)+)
LELAEEINSQHLNSAYLGDYVLPAELEASVDLERLVKHADVIAMAVPAQGFRHVAQQVAKHVAAGVPIMSLSKGLESETLLRMSEVLASEMPNNPRAVLSGPNLAHEILQGQPAASVVACSDDAVAL